MITNGTGLAIKYFLKSEFLKDRERWFTTREISGKLGLSVQRTRRYLSLLSLNGNVKTRVDCWSNVYCFYKD